MTASASQPPLAAGYAALPARGRGGRPAHAEPGLVGCVAQTLSDTSKNSLPRAQVLHVLAALSATLLVAPLLLHPHVSGAFADGVKSLHQAAVPVSVACLGGLTAVHSSHGRLHACMRVLACCCCMRRAVRPLAR